MLYLFSMHSLLVPRAKALSKCAPDCPPAPFQYFTELQFAKVFLSFYEFVMEELLTAPPPPPPSHSQPADIAASKSHSSCA